MGQRKATAFDEAYNTLIKVHDEGTYLEINKDSLNYKVKYCNMSKLVN